MWSIDEYKTVEEIKAYGKGYRQGFILGMLIAMICMMVGYSCMYVVHILTRVSN